MYHAAPLMFSIYDNVNGAPIVIMPRWDESAALRVLMERGIAHAHLVPTMFVRLLRLPEAERAAFDAPALSLVLHGAAPVSVAVKRRMIEWWGEILVEYWGATEGGVNTLIGSREWLENPGSVGRVLDGFSVFAVDAAGERLPAGEVGDLYCRNARLPRAFEYHNDPEKTARAYLEPHVFTIGDIGSVDAEGYVYLADRRSNMIISGGVNIYPVEIENVLNEHPAIADAGVFGIPDDEWGESVKAAVELRPGFKRVKRSSARSSSSCARSSPATRSRARSTSRPRCRVTPPASSTSGTCATPTGRGGSAASDGALCMTGDIAALRARMRAERPALVDEAVRHRASVALVLCEVAAEPSLLMIMRAANEADRWSGDIAFPGGRVADTDADPRATAERETHEEVGLRLEPAHYVGRLPDLLGNTESIVVSAFVYALPGGDAPPPLTPNYEVAHAFWTPVADILDEANHVERDFRYLDRKLPLPGLRVLDPEHPVLWGLSYRFLELLMARLGHSIPSMPWRTDL